MRTLIKSKMHMFRPGVYFRSCHASTLIRLRDGTILSAWFAGTHENHVDVQIWLGEMREGVWEEPRRVAGDDKWPCWNPVLHLGDNGIVYLFYKVGQNPDVWHTMLITSRDNGRTWTEPVKLVADDSFGRGPVKDKLIVAGDGRDRVWLAPASIEDGGKWDAFVDISPDWGKTWTMSEMVPLDHAKLVGPGVIQPTLWESEPGRVHMLLRSSGGLLYRADSEDGARTWCQAYPTQLPNNNSGIDVVRMDSGILALAYNPVGLDWGIRTPLSLSFSEDNGKIWTEPSTLEENLNPLDREDGEFSYPAIIAQGNRLHISYTWRRKTVEYVEIEVLA